MTPVQGRPKRQPATRRRHPVDEHTWHDCPLPPPPNNSPNTHDCATCGQHWIWSRPPRPAAQWIRQTPEEET